MSVSNKGQDAPIRKAWMLLFVTLTTGLLAACGGGGGGGSASEQRSSEAPQQTSRAPDQLSSQITAQRHLLLSWSDNSQDEYAFSIYRKLSTHSHYSRIAHLQSNIEQWTDNTVESGNRYHYYVLANRSDGDLQSPPLLSDLIPSIISSQGASILLPSGLSGDGENMDINPQQRREDNDSIYGAYSVPEQNGRKSTVAGAVTRFDDDRRDFFQTSLMQGERISLSPSDDTANNADADLYLYDEQLNLVNASLSPDANESLTINQAGNYTLEVAHRSGDRIKYQLSFEDAPIDSASHAYALDGNFIEGEYIVSHSNTGLMQPLSLLNQIISAPLVSIKKQGGASSLLKVDDIQALVSQLLSGLLSRNQQFQAYQQRREQFSNAATRRAFDGLQLARLLEDALGTTVEPNQRLDISGLSSDDSAAAYQWGGEQIGLENAWNYSSGANVRVAVIDTGFLLNHRDLQGAFGEGWNYVDDNNNPAATAQLSLQHGTHIAGIIAAQRDNGFDIAGIAPDVTIMPIKVMRPGCICGSLYDAMQGIRWAAGLDNSAGTKASQPAQVINLSIDLPSTHSSILADAINAANAAGSVVVWSAGNSSKRIQADSNHSLQSPGLFVVSATGLYGKIASYSNYGNVVDLSAPGGDSIASSGGQTIRSLVGQINSDGSESYSNGNMQGTSQAAPHVAGVFALMASVWPDFNASDLETLMAEGKLSHDSGAPGQDEHHGHGRIDAERAVLAALNVSQQAVNNSAGVLRLSANPGELNFGGSFTSLRLNVEANQAQVAKLEVYYQPDWLSLQAANTDSNGLGDWLVNIDRSNFGNDLYQDVIVLQSGGSKLYVPVSAHGEDYLPRGTGISKMLVQFLNPDSRQIEHYLEASIDSMQGFSFSSQGVPSGNYIIRASSDLDNNGLYCESGEFCGYLNDDAYSSYMVSDSSSLDGSEIPLQLLQ